MAQPNPVELYEAAVQKMLPIIGNVTPGQMEDPTPCSEWSVKNLVIHNLKVAQFTAALVTGDTAGDPMEVMRVEGDLPSEGAGEAFDSATKSVLQAIRAQGATDKAFQTPMGEMTAADLLLRVLGDVVIHKWDLGKATSQDTSIDAGLAQAVYNSIQQDVAQARDMGAFGAEVQVPSNAGIQDQLLGLAGRQP